jgi:hypothetical protein
MRSESFSHVTVEGAILPIDLLQRIVSDPRLEGLRPEDFSLALGERLSETTSHAWTKLSQLWAGLRPLLDSTNPPSVHKWLDPFWRELGYGRLDKRAAPFLIDEKPYPISHSRGCCPIHIVEWSQNLDRRVESSEGKFPSPHSMTQEFLNRSEAHLWAFVCNGRTLRILRDNIRLTRQAYVEFDLQAIFDSHSFADFTLLFRLCHESRVLGDAPQECWLERWSKVAINDGLRALDQLRGGVERAVEALGRGFLHPANSALISALRAGSLSSLDYYRQLLRIVYRLLFLFVAEDRDLLFAPEVPLAVRERYTQFYSTARLRRIAEQIRGTPHTDLFAALRIILHALGKDGCPALGLGELGGLFDLERTADLNDACIANADLLEAIRALSIVADKDARVLRAVDYRNLGAEELGSVYESLLELQPIFTPGKSEFNSLQPQRTQRDTEKTQDNRPEIAGSLGSSFSSASSVPSVVQSFTPGKSEFNSLQPQRTQRDTEKTQDNRPEIAGSLGSSFSSASSVPSVVQSSSNQPDFRLAFVAGNARKTTGSYYTPKSLISCLLDSALDPVLANAATEERILDLKVCDPACGSGHFLIAAAHRIAKRLASLRTGEEEPAPDAIRHAVRDVVSRCIFGVDINPMAVELCQVALWMEAMEPGKPLTFLRHHIQCGNALMGATQELLEAGIVDAAFEPIEGDHKPYAAQWKKSNAKERKDRKDGQLMLDDVLLPALGNYVASLAALDAAPDDTPDRVRAKADQYDRLMDQASYRTSGRFLADTWCAAFVWKKTKDFDYPITENILRRIQKNPHDVTPWMFKEIVRLREQYQFFHWELAFPGVFLTEQDRDDSSRAGFDVVLGNPPWERIKLQEQEWFRTNGRDDIAGARNAAVRGQLITALKSSNLPSDIALHCRFLDDRREAEGESHFVRHSGRYPLCGRGDVNTYSLFAETNRRLINATGRVGCIVPTGIATDDTTKVFFQDVVEKRSLHSYFGFKNERFLFPKPVEHTVTFGLLTMSGSAVRAETMTFCWNVWTVDEMKDTNRRITLSPADFALLNPNTRTCPVFRSARDAELTKAIYRRVPVLLRESEPPVNPWGVSFLRMLDMANDSKSFKTAADLDGKDRSKYVPLYEAKLLHQFDHRWATYDDGDTRDMTAEEKADPHRCVTPRYWVKTTDVEERLKDRWDRGWLLGWRDICRNTDIRTTIAAVAPRVGVGHKAPLFLPRGEPQEIACFYANLNTFILDYSSRQKLGGTSMTIFVLKQIPILPPDTYARPAPSPCWRGGLWGEGPLAEWLLPRVVELTYTAHDLRAFAADCGYDGEPFRWDEERRFWLRCELDAAYFQLYGLTREEVEYVMETFPIVKQKDIERHNEYRTKSTILHIYDALANGNYQSPLSPPPGDERARHGSSKTGPRRLSDVREEMPSEEFELELSESEIGKGQATRWRCRPTPGEKVAEGTMVLLRHERLKRGNATVGIAVGRLSVNRLKDGVEVMIKGVIPPAVVRLTLAEWENWGVDGVLEEKR